MRGLLRGVLLGSCVLSAFACGGSGDAVSQNGDDDDDGSGGSGASGTGGNGGGGDCDPDATESCNGLDDDCDGDVDEPPCTCAEGDTQPCYSGRPADSAGKGECKQGTQTCQAGGTWGACTGEVTPAAEECNSLDDNCNDVLDDLGDETCGVGACLVTVPKCVSGNTSTCTPLMPSVEICNAIDDDCDQLTDETFPNSGSTCNTGSPGACAAGTLQCMGGAETCVPDLSAVNETCNGLDDDCNGTVDDNVPGTGGLCDTGFPGICGPGTMSCQGGIIDCFSDVPPSAELCDLVDNDCDGAVDNGNPGGGAFCSTGLLGACQAGTETCQNGQISCAQDVQSGPELCDMIDNDCDGQIDDNTNLTETFENGNNGWSLGAGWTIAPFAGYNGGNGLGFGNGATFPYAPSPVVASKTFNIPAGAPTLTLNWRVGSNDYCCDSLQIKLGGVVILTATVGSAPAGWQTLTYNIPANMQGTQQLFEATFVTLDSLYNNGIGGNVDNVTIPCN